VIVFIRRFIFGESVVFVLVYLWVSLLVCISAFVFVCICIYERYSLSLVILWLQTGILPISPAAMLAQMAQFNIFESCQRGLRRGG
jgi:hypothetical protein